MSTRARLTAAYAILLLATFIVFGVTLSATRNSAGSTLEASALAQASAVRTSIRQFQADTSGCELENELQALKERGAARKGCRLVVVDTANGQLVARPTRDLVKVLESLPGYF